ncbi:MULTISPECIES: type II toxin-antitoxin system RelB/DinJ family antitoxin [Psychrobacter]|jgi:addiction module RelB/DinJ family antitoxin|uniref:type II toxin-antitoxin system RelB/DinJ family antitoxin n=1 Tax=Psychrobacter TaxID=497 RepID=UPI00071E6AF7|nr:MULTISPECIES: type II toxin-antitoxin system RelB/DinJ family antitoxin [Psychrobacter]MCG3873707.1 type II toxin-antitoxin system RelB/DinJ family antitoxin [Psychrobacter sp. Ps7]MCH1783931.1 type II toxin-antitoxin system RelB/DinJ family antitoxin [Psychrobacter glaciei]NRD71260.1 type II toxin-antitoxin system RelB/DinJ family antitoxin [Psychrobacter okhotskensis]PAT62164.1 type II toxin-antitoxin system antitoxin, RelB/DinJ family [Psychrobacter sp. JB193]WGV14475.1 type II toxin-ant|tara:strand:+ start:1905 stop:2132 length:228 start_codon:yes stop_codon:yes gene_type:complete
MTTTNYNIRLDQELKENAFAVFESYGLTPSQAIKLFLTQVAQTNQVPLSFEYQKVSAVSQDELLIYKEHTDRENR